MGTGYTRNDTANNIADGNVINASDLDGEFDAVQAAFNGTTGHSHDGTSGEGPQIAAGGLASNAVTTAKINNSAVTTDKIANSNVTLAKMATNSVDSDQYVDGSIDTVHIANNAVTLGTKTSGNYVAAGATSGTGISGSVSSEGGTFTVTSNATNANTAGTIVARDGSGNFSAGTITASLTGTASNAALLDNLDSSQFLRSDAGDSASQRMVFNANNTNNWDTIATATGSLGAIEVFNNGASNDAFMAFHVGSDFALYFGLDGGINDLAVGGWSMGANSYRIWHQGNDGSGSGLDSDTVDGVQASSFLRSDVGDTKTSGNLNFSDNIRAVFGNSSDLQIYHNGSNSIISDGGTGNLNIQANNLRLLNAGATENYIQADSNGEVRLYYDNAEKLNTKSDGVLITGELEASSLDINGAANISGTLTMGGNVDLQDNDKLMIGSGDDLQIYHDGSNSYITDSGTGHLRIRATNLYLQDASGNNYIALTDNGTGGTVDLKYNTASKLTTTSSGVSVTGTVTATAFSGDGSALTGISGGKIAQVLQTSKTSTFSTTSTASAGVEITGLTRSITPSATSSKVLVTVSLGQTSNSAANWRTSAFILQRGTTPIGIGDAAGSRIRTSFAADHQNNSSRGTNALSFTFLDSPSTTSSVTYSVHAVNESDTLYVNRTTSDNNSTATHGQRTASTIQCMEVLA